MPAPSMSRLCSVFAVALLAALAVAPAAAASKRERPARVPALQVVPERVYAINGKRVALVHSRVRFRGRVRDYVPGQVFSVRVPVGKRRYVRTTRIATPRGPGGEFVVELKAHRVGRIRAIASGAGLRARSRSVHVVPASAAYGEEGLHVQFLQRRLRDLRYLVGLSGRLDGSTQRAIMAYRKVNGLPRSFRASRTIFDRLAQGRGRFHSRFPTHGKHVEADLSRQVLVLHDRRGRVFRILHTASGTSATPTVRGSFRVYSKTWGVNSLGMVHSVYFHRGYAIHGYPSVPAGPASHGCLRIPIPNARFVYRWLDFGDVIDVYP